MRFRSAVVFGLGLALGLSGCASAAGGNGGGGGPMVSPRGTVYEPGIQPEDTQLTNEAQLYLAQGQFEQALQSAQAGIAEDSTNARYFYIAGSAYAGLGDFDAADEMWRTAEELFPAYELEIEPVREEAWLAAFQEGLELFQADDQAGAIAAWERANSIYKRNPEAFQNLAILYTQAGDYDRAIENYRGALAALDMQPETRELSPEEIESRTTMRPEFAAALGQLLMQTERYDEAVELYRGILDEDPMDLQARSALASALALQGNASEAEAIYTELLEDPNLGSSELWTIGISLFQAGDYPRAETAFSRYVEDRPYSRDGWYNLTVSLYQQEKWEDLAPAAERVREIDPLNENIAYILRDAYRGLDRTNDALTLLQGLDQLPVFTDQIMLANEENGVSLSGQIIGHRAEAGTPIELRVTFYANGNSIGTGSTTVPAPAEGETASFRVEVATTQNATGFTYELVD